MTCRISAACCALPALVALSSGCDNPVRTEEPAPLSLLIVSGGEQTGAVGEELPERLVVRLTHQVGRYTVPVPRHLVNFRVLSGGGSMFAGAALTDLNGVAQDYWTLGPNPGVNVVEVRSVNSTTGEKQVFATFRAFGVVRGPEVCNGLDDNLDRTVDDPTWRYCIGGVPAPNTDGMNACRTDYMNLNGTASDGCERLIGGRWVLDPAVTMACPGIPDLISVLLSNTVTVRDARITVLSDAAIRISVRPDVGLLPLLEFQFDVPVVPVSETFAASTPYSFENIPLALGAKATGSGTVAVAGMFTGPASFQTRFQLTLDLTLHDLPFPLNDGPGDCEDVDVSVIGARVSS